MSAFCDTVIIVEVREKEKSRTCLLRCGPRALDNVKSNGHDAFDPDNMVKPLLVKHINISFYNSRVEADPDKMVMISKDAAFTENPMER